MSNIPLPDSLPPSIELAWLYGCRRALREIEWDEVLDLRPLIGQGILAARNRLRATVKSVEDVKPLLDHLPSEDRAELLADLGVAA